MNLRIDTLGKKIGIGFMALLALLLIAVTITIIQVKSVSTTSDRLINLRQPSSRSDLELLNGINHSIAITRGWLIIQDNRFKEELKQCRDEEIFAPLSKLQSLSSNWTNQKNIQSLSELTPLIYELVRLQDNVVAIAETDKEAAAKLLEQSVLPLTIEIRAILNQLVVDHEQLTQADFDSISRQINFLTNLEWLLIIIGLIVGVFLSFIITRSAVNPISKAVGVADNIANGNLATEINVAGFKEVDLLGGALRNMRDSLVAKNKETTHHAWLSSGQNQLHDVIRGDHSVHDLADRIITFVSNYTLASMGAIHLLNDQEDHYQLEAVFAYSGDQLKKNTKTGEGLIGQAAADKTDRLLSNIEATNLRISSTFLDADKINIYVVPFLFENRVIGVIELAKFTSFGENEIEFIRSITDTIGIAVNSAIARKKIQDLLEETRVQSEELQQQQEELQQTNEELEEQTQSLREQQEELQVANEELEEQSQMVEEKNKDLETARMDIELKAKQLEITNKYKSEFLANMSHELRTPLNSLLILSKDLSYNSSGNLNADQIESAEVINKCGYDLLNLINEILDLSKIEAGKMDLNITDVAINDLVGSIKRNFQKQAESKGIRLEVSVDETMPEMVRTDQQRLEQILRNLISNAIKFTHQGSVSVDFVKDAGNNISIQVRDTGIGIPKDKLDVVFEAFQQVDGSTSRKYGGTGLGLSISRELARLLNGKITLHSELGKGSLFTLIIPAIIKDDNKNYVQESEDISTKQKANVLPESTDLFLNYPCIEDDRESLSAGDRVILIIEDELDFAKILAKQATEKGFRFLSAATGEDGLLLAEKFRPDAIILDIGLPGIDGKIVLSKIKTNPELRHIPVHVISGRDEIINPVQLGAVEFLNKPVTKEQLTESFEKLELFLSRKMKNLLIVEDDDVLRKSIVKLIGNGDVKCYEAKSAAEAIDQLEKLTFDCIVMDLGLPDMNGETLIKKLNELSGNDVHIPPVIIYTGKELTREENDELRQYAETIIVKGVMSEDRLLDETALFLHRTIKNLPKQKQEIIFNLYSKDNLFKGKEILLVDDDMRNVFALSKVLKDQGFNVHKADNGKTALKALDENPKIELVLMDIMMPEMDGYECMHEIRKQKRFKSLPVIALTAKAMKEDRKKCIDAGANDYITKPVDIERLLSMMRIWLQQQ